MVYIAVGFVSQPVNDAENPLYSDSGLGGSLGRSSIGGDPNNHFKNPLYAYAEDAEYIAANSYYTEDNNTTPPAPGIHMNIP